MSQGVNEELFDTLTREQLIEKIARYKGEIVQLREEQRRMNTLFSIMRNLAQELDLDTVLKMVMDEVKDVLQADRCTVFLVDEERGELWSRIGHGLENMEIRFPKSKGIAGFVASTGEVLKIDDCYNDPHFNPEIDKKTGYYTRNLLTVPMRNKKAEVIGVFQVLNKHNGAFTDNDVRMLEAIAPIAAVQIENAQLYDDLRKTFDSFIFTLAKIVDARDPLTAGHSYRIMRYADYVAMKAGWNKHQREELKTAALLHDLGKIGIREYILTKNTQLSPEEYEHIKQHVLFTSLFLREIHFSSEFKQVPEIAGSHHERMDGSGYPSGLKGEKIPAGGRILAIVDIFDALTSKRHYRDRMAIEQVVHLLKKRAGQKFDAHFVELFLSIPLSTMLEILEFERKEPIDPTHLKTLKSYSLQDFLADSKIDDEARRIFDGYYWRQTEV